MATLFSPTPTPTSPNPISTRTERVTKELVAQAISTLGLEELKLVEQGKTSAIAAMFSKLGDVRYQEPAIRVLLMHAAQVRLQSRDASELYIQRHLAQQAINNDDTVAVLDHLSVVLKLSADRTLICINNDLLVSLWLEITLDLIFFAVDGRKWPLVSEASTLLMDNLRASNLWGKRLLSEKDVLQIVLTYCQAIYHMFVDGDGPSEMDLHHALDVLSRWKSIVDHPMLGSDLLEACLYIELGLRAQALQVLQMIGENGDHELSERQQAYLQMTELYFQSGDWEACLETCDTLSAICDNKEMSRRAKLLKCQAFVALGDTDHLKRCVEIHRRFRLGDTLVLALAKLSLTNGEPQGVKEAQDMLTLLNASAHLREHAKKGFIPQLIVQAFVSGRNFGPPDITRRNFLRRPFNDSPVVMSPDTSRFPDQKVTGVPTSSSWAPAHDDAKFTGTQIPFGGSSSPAGKAPAPSKSGNPGIKAGKAGFTAPTSSTDPMPGAVPATTVTPLPSVETLGCPTGILNAGNTCYLGSLLQCLRKLRSIDYELPPELVPLLSSKRAPTEVQVNKLRTLLGFQAGKMQDSHECWTMMMNRYPEMLRAFHFQQQESIRCEGCQFERRQDVLIEASELTARPAENVNTPQLLIQASNSSSTGAASCAQCTEEGKQCIGKISTRSFATVPQILMINIARATRGAQKCLTRLRDLGAPVTLDKYQFAIKAAIFHRGYTAAAGHYIAVVCYDNWWVRYSDHHPPVICTSIEEARPPSKDYTASMLFYTRTTIDAKKA